MAPLACPSSLPLRVNAVDTVQPREWEDLLPSVPEVELVQAHYISLVDLAVLVELVAGKMI